MSTAESWAAPVGTLFSKCLDSRSKTSSVLLPVCASSRRCLAESDEIKIAFGVFEKHRLTGGQRAGCEGRLCQKKEREKGDQVKGYCKFVSHRHRSFRLFSVLKMFFERFEAFFERFIFLF